MSARDQFTELTAVLIDDNSDHIALIRNAFEQAFLPDDVLLTVREFSHPADGLAELPDDDPQVVLLDYQFSGSTGIAWIADFVRQTAAPVIIVTSSGDEHIAARAFRAGASDYIVKSDLINNPEYLKASVMESLRKNQLRRTNRELSRKLKNANTELQCKNKKLLELTETAHRFVEDVAHEFRTPLTVIKEFASIIDDGIGGQVTNKQSEYLGHIIGSAGDLAELVNDFLNCSRLRSNNICVQREQNSVAELIQTTWPILQSRANAKSVDIEYKVAPGLPAVYADADKVQRSLINLVMNAIKYSGPGSFVHINAESETEHSVRISVRDNGPGLPQESVKELFDRFQRGSAASNRLANGFGLGLCIVKELVTLNLGKVQVQSEFGVGSTFSFTLPCFSITSILHALIEQASETTPDHTIAVLSAHAPHGDASKDHIMSMLSEACMPNDLVLPAPDQDLAYLIGITNNPTLFSERVAQVIKNQETNYHDAQRSHASHVMIEAVGHWPPSHALEPISELLQATSESEAQLDTISSHH